MGATCEQAMAAAFAITGAISSSYNGLYAKTAHVCSDKPVYQKGGSDGDVLFQPTGHSDWMVGPSDRATSCEDSGYLESFGNGADCPNSPDGAGCEGKWQEWDGSDWNHNPSLAVASQGR